MKLTYEFENEDFDFEADLKDYLDSLSEAKICDLGKQLYNELSEEEKKSLEDDFGAEVLTFKPYNEESVELARSIIEDTDDNILLDIVGDEIHDFFDKDAKDEYEDQKSYDSDIYGYFGVSEKDFY